MESWGHGDRVLCPTVRNGVHSETPPLLRPRRGLLRPLAKVAAVKVGACKHGCDRGRAFCGGGRGRRVSRWGRRRAARGSVRSAPAAVNAVSRSHFAESRFNDSATVTGLRIGRANV